VNKEPNCSSSWGAGTATRRRRRRQRESRDRQPISDRSSCARIVLRSQSAGEALKRGPLPTDGVSSGPTKVVRALLPSRRVPSFLFASHRFSGLLPRIRIKFGLRNPAVVQDRPDPGRIASETCIATRVRCTLCNLQICSSHVRTKSLVAGQPGQPPVHQISGSLIPTQMFPRTEPQM